MAEATSPSVERGRRRGVAGWMRDFLGLEFSEEIEEGF